MVASARAQSSTPTRDLPVSRLEVLGPPAVQPATVPVTRLSDRTDLDAPRTLSLTFPRPAPVRDVLLLLVRGTSISTVLDASVRGTFTGQLRGLTVRQALEAVLFAANLDYEVRGTVVHVFPRRPRTRLYSLNLVSTRRALTTAADSRVTSSSQTDALSEIDAGVASLLSQQGRHHVDRRAGLVSVTDFADRLDQIGIYLEAAQLRAVRQVRMDARVVQIALKEDVRGIDIRSLAARTDSGIRKLSADSAGFLVTDVDRFVQALQQWGQVTTTTAPSLVAINNEPAVVRVSTEIDTGTDVNLAVTPQISADGFVQLGIVSSYRGSSGPDEAPARVHADTIVRVREAETVMVSGLLHASAGPVPPARRTETIVLLTPTIVNPSRPSPAGDR